MGSNSSLPTSKSRKFEVRQDVAEAIRLILYTLDSVADGVPVPGVKVCFSILQWMWEANDMAFENEEELEELSKYLDGFREALTFKGPGSVIQSELSRRIENTFAEFDQNQEEIRSAQDRHWLSKRLHAEEDAIFIRKMFRKVKAIAEWFQLAAIRNIEEAVQKQAQELLASRLPLAKTAHWNTADCDECLEGTRANILDTMESWMLDVASPQVFWIKGFAGKGKSTITKSLARRADEKHVLGGSFFCFRNDTVRRNPKYIIPTLAEQLCTHFPECSQRFYEAIEKNPGVGLHSLADQFALLIRHPFEAAIAASSHSTLLVIDALDEIDEHPTQPSAFVSALLTDVRTIPRMKLLISSRPEYPIRTELHPLISNGRAIFLDLNEVPRKDVDKDIDQYLRSYLHTKLHFSTDIIEDNSYDIQNLVQRSSQLFIFASTAAKTIDSEGDLHEQLSNVAAITSIDDLYSAILRPTLISAEICRLLGVIVILRQPLSVNALAKLLELQPARIRQFLNSFHSVLSVPPIGDEESPIRIIHTSFRDFLMDPARCSISKFQQMIDTLQVELSLRVFIVLKELDVLELDSDYLIHSDLPSSLQQQAHVDYACHFWADHLSSISQSEVPQRILDSFRAFVWTQRWRWRAYLLNQDDAVHPAQIWTTAKAWYDMLPQTRGRTTLDFYLNGFLAQTYMERADVLGRLDDCDVALTAFRETLASTVKVPLHERCELLSSFAGALQIYDGQTGTVAHLEERQRVLDGALRLATFKPTRAKLLCAQGIMMSDRYFRQSNDPADLDKSILLRQEACSLHPGHPLYLDSLGSAFLSRYRANEDASDLHAATRALRDALGNSRERGYHVSSPIAVRFRLASALLLHYRLSKNVRFLKEALDLARQAVTRSLPAHRFLVCASYYLTDALRETYLVERHKDTRVAILRETIEVACHALTVGQPRDWERDDLQMWLSDAREEKKRLEYGN
ncbi:hypothetical protein HGRIS_000850 [Hohenbuehelia grisea]|uniref:NACHT domain-containing protein n=1 Tax=Hohenbuehelia grisea TaxID=104357 RepID=A0ABR3IPY2_9AGAR